MGESMRGVIANNGRLRSCARDFWHVVGWTFNCSINNPRRWKYWRVWLDYMLDVLDADLTERQRLDSPEVVIGASNKDNRKGNYLQGALLGRYLSDVEGRSSAMKRVVRAVFADGGPDSLKEFPAVFPNETQQGGVRKQKRKRDTPLDGVYGDQDEDDETDGGGTEPSGSQHEDVSHHSTWAGNDKGRFPPTTSALLGGPESVNMRQRLLGVVSGDPRI